MKMFVLPAHTAVFPEILKVGLAITFIQRTPIIVPPQAVVPMTV